MAQQREAKFVNDWLRMFHSSALQWKRVRLGPDLPGGIGKMLDVVKKYVDAIFYENNIVHLVEAKIRTQSAAIGQLEIYTRLFRDTPEFLQYSDKPIQGILLVPTTDIDVKNLALEKGFKYEVFSPDWLEM